MVSHQNGESLSVESGGRWLFHPRKPSWTFGATVDRNAIIVTTTREIARHIRKDRSKEAFLGGRGNQGVKCSVLFPVFYLQVPSVQTLPGLEHSRRFQRRGLAASANCNIPFLNNLKQRLAAEMSQSVLSL